MIIAWTPISLVIQGGIGFGFLRLAGACLNPVKNNKKREREYDRRNMKKVGVQPSFDELNPEMPMQGIIPPTPGVSENAEVDNTVVDNTVVDNTVVDNTVVDNTVVDNTVVENTVTENTVTENTVTENPVTESVAETPVTQDATLS